MAFDLAKCRELHRDWPREVLAAEDREAIDRLRWACRQYVRTSVRCFGLEPEDEAFRPSSPNYLYVLAQEAWTGSYEDYERWLKALGLEATTDTIAAADERLRIAFISEGHNVRVWGREPSPEARKWLRDKVQGGPEFRTRGTRLDLSEVSDTLGTEDAELLAFAEAEIKRSKVAELRAALEGLPERQLQMLMLRAAGHKYEEIAQEMGISVSTVKGHARALRQKPHLKRIQATWYAGE